MLRGKKTHKQLYKHLYIYPPLSADSTFCMFSVSCVQTTRVHPTRWGWFSGAKMLCPMAFPCSVPNHSFLLADVSVFCHSTCNHVCSSLPCCPCSSVGHPQAADSSGMYLPPFGIRAKGPAHLQLPPADSASLQYV